MLFPNHFIPAESRRIFGKCVLTLLVFYLIIPTEVTGAGEITITSFQKKNVRILILAPHPDDETLACGGIIASNVLLGNEVRVAIMTNGEAYTYSMSRENKKLSLTPSQYISFAYMRQLETISSLQTLGLSSDMVIFMGYPDSGIMNLWDKNWAENKLFISPYTRLAYASFTNSYDRESPYCGSRVLKNIKQIIREFMPTHIFIPSSIDWHPDHRATFNFAVLAIEDMALKGEIHLNTLKVFTYLVHFGYWPKPRGLRMESRLMPPEALENVKAEWLSFSLDFTIKQKKYEAILKYESQLRTSKSYLFSFVRENELFQTWNVIHSSRIDKGKILIDGLDEEWSDIHSIPVFSFSENILSALEHGSNIRSFSTCTDEKYFYLKWNTARKPGKSTYFYIRIYPLSMKNTTSLLYLKLRPWNNFSGNIKIGKDDFYVRDVCELRIPLESLGHPEAVSINLESSSLLLPLVKTPVFIVQLPKRGE